MQSPIEILKRATWEVGLQRESNQRGFVLQLLHNVRLYLEEPEKYCQFRRGASTVRLLWDVKRQARR